MHELHTTQDLLEHTLEHAEKADAKEIAAVHIRVGELSTYTEESIRFYWSQLSAGTIAEGAELKIQLEEGQYHCSACSYTFKSGDLEAICPNCGNVALVVTAGRDIYLEALDIIPSEAGTPVS